MEDTGGLLQLFHSILRWLVLISVGISGIVALKGYLQKTPIIVWERSLTILAMVVCHIQLLIGGGLYAMKFKTYDAVTARGNQSWMGDTVRRFWKFEHIGGMVVAIALITVGRVLSKRAQEESKKQRHIVVFYGIGLLLILVSIPWPFREAFRSFGWL